MSKRKITAMWVGVALLGGLRSVNGQAVDYHVVKDFLRSGPDSDPATVSYRKKSGEDEELSIIGSASVEFKQQGAWFGIFPATPYVGVQVRDVSTGDQAENSLLPFAIVHFETATKWPEKFRLIDKSLVSGDGFEFYAGLGYEFNDLKEEDGLQFLFDWQPWQSKEVEKEQNPAEAEGLIKNGVRRFDNLAYIDRNEPTDFHFAPRFGVKYLQEVDGKESLNDLGSDQLDAIQSGDITLDQLYGTASLKLKFFVEDRYEISYEHNFVHGFDEDNASFEKQVIQANYQWGSLKGKEDQGATLTISYERGKDLPGAEREEVFMAGLGIRI